MKAKFVLELIAQPQSIRALWQRICIDNRRVVGNVFCISIGELLIIKNVINTQNQNKLLCDFHIPSPVKPCKARWYEDKAI